MEIQPEERQKEVCYTQTCQGPDAWAVAGPFFPGFLGESGQIFRMRTVLQEGLRKGFADRFFREVALGEPVPGRVAGFLEAILGVTEEATDRASRPLA